jgi:hypothetical protein
MIRNSLKLTALGAIALLGGAIGVNCSKGGGTSGDSGNLKIAFAIPGGDSISTVNYKVTATTGGAVLVQGSMNTADPNATASLDLALPPTAAGATDTIVLTATTDKGVACATAPVSFTVTSNTNTNVMLALACGTAVPQTVPGTVDVTATVSNTNSCPSITSAVVGPDQTSVGATVAVSETAVDPDNDPLTVTWGPAANVAAPGSASTTYTCTTAGTQSITLKVSDGQCEADVTLTVVCVGGTATGGTTGAAGAPATGGTTGTGGTPATGGTTGAAGSPATGGTTGTGGTPATGGTTGTGGVNGAVACATCEFNDSANLGFCSGVTVSGNFDTVSDFGCNSLTSATDIANCNALVACLRGAACQSAIKNATADFQEAGSNFDDPHPCLCGTASFSTCLGEANSAFNGVCAGAYLTAVNGDAGDSILNHLGDPASPIGIADDLMTCDVDSTVAANGLQNCASSCALGQ